MSTKRKHESGDKPLETGKKAKKARKTPSYFTLEGRRDGPNEDGVIVDTEYNQLILKVDNGKGTTFKLEATTLCLTKIEVKEFVDKMRAGEKAYVKIASTRAGLTCIEYEDGCLIFTIDYEDRWHQQELFRLSCSVEIDDEQRLNFVSLMDGLKKVCPDYCSNCVYT
jgi:hypothetical protein